MPDNKRTFVVEIVLGTIPATIFMLIYGFIYGLVILLGGLYEVGFLFVSGYIFGLAGTIALWRGAFFFRKPVKDQNRVTAFKIAIFLVIGLIPAFVLLFSSSSESLSLEFPFEVTFMLLGPIAVAFKYLVLINSVRMTRGKKLK